MEAFQCPGKSFEATNELQTARFTRNALTVLFCVPFLTRRRALRWRVECFSPMSYWLCLHAPAALSCIVLPRVLADILMIIDSSSFLGVASICKANYPSTSVQEPVDSGVATAWVARCAMRSAISLSSLQIHCSMHHPHVEPTGCINPLAFHPDNLHPHLLLLHFSQL